MTHRLSERARRALPVLAGLMILLVALEVIRIELRAVSGPDLMTDVVGLPRGQLALAILLTVLNYAVLTGILTFLAGLVLLFSGATPASGPRLAALSRVAPLRGSGPRISWPASPGPGCSCSRRASSGVSTAPTTRCVRSPTTG